MTTFYPTQRPVLLGDVWHQHHRSERHPSFWLHSMVHIGGGSRTVIAVTNEYGDLVDIDLAAAVATFANGDH